MPGDILGRGFFRDLGSGKLRMTFHQQVGAGDPAS